MKFETTIHCESCQHSVVCKHLDHYLLLYEKVKELASDDTYGDLFTLFSPKCAYHTPKPNTPRNCG